MKSILDNRLLFWSLAALLTYWTAAGVVPGQFMSSTASLMLLISGGVTFMRYADDAFAIVIRGRRNPASEDGDGSHLAAYGVTLLSAGSFYVGLFGLLWVFMGQPDGWLGSAVSGFGRALMGVGFLLLFFAPDVSRRKLRLPQWYWIALTFAAIMALLIVFFLGVQFGQEDTVGVQALVVGKLSGPMHPA